ncbi:synaptonemal complex protein 1-like [Mya arenaria]|uniref:synaptonemal complex protein 1-like n=1 Tax=Mya arenaria TaxID=6604 RepID=UPI0022E53126|nr:synaptonemal complex protein 1-like [Mya arenaria]
MILYFISVILTTCKLPIADKMKYYYAFCFMLLNSVISFHECIADETHDILFKLLSNEKEIISNKKRIDDLEMQFKTSMEGLNTRLSEELSKITETLKRYEPGIAEIRKDIKDTISNTVTQMVKSQHVALNKAMKREKAAMLKTQTEIKEHMNLMNTAFNNTQKKYEERFTNLTAKLQDEFQAQKESAEYFMTKVFNESEEHVKQLMENYERAQGKFENIFANNTDTFDSKFKIQTKTVDNLIKTVLNESKQLQQIVDVYTEETKNTTQGLEDGLKEALEQMRNKLLENLNDETSSLKSRLTSQENSHSSLTSQLSGLQASLRSYKSAADSVGSSVSSIERRMTSQHVGFSARLYDLPRPLPRSTKIVFDEERFDASYSYDKSTGIFKAPISGMYLFLVTIESSESKSIDVCLAVRGLCRVYISLSPYRPERGTNFCVVYMSAGDTAYVNNQSANAPLREYVTTFSGVLIHI